MQIKEKRAIYAILFAFFSPIFASLTFAALPMQSENGSQSTFSHDLPIIRVLRSDEQAIVLEFSAKDFQQQEQWIDGRRFDFLSLPESGYTSEIGAPQLPIKGVLIATPPEAEARLTVLESSTVVLDGYDIPPVPTPTVGPIEDEVLDG